MEKREQLLEEIKVHATEIAKTHGKQALLDVNEKIVPLLLDIVADAIPGTIDDAVLEGAKPLVKNALDSAIGNI